ncbi:aryl-sulfate sulfotransferase [Shewanella sp. GXUN23E]|uniref:aryl-sulfate sulfotransferase n=1 Tax=Shewanella sp. GXUN23E TaxID=3422498 RepID=UPI003D7C8C2D
MMKRTVLATTLMLTMGTAIAAGFPSAPPAGNAILGAMQVDPYGHSPLTALLDLNSKRPTDVQVTVHGKGKQGIDIIYNVGQATLNTHDGIPVFGLYADHDNSVTVSFTLNGKKYKENYSVLTSPITNKYLDNRDKFAIPKAQAKIVAKGFEDRLYLVNTHTHTTQGSDLGWMAAKNKTDNGWGAPPSGGSLPFEAAPQTYVVDTQGEIRWWLDPDAVYDAKAIDVSKRGYLMGFHDNGKGGITFVQGQRYGTFNLLGQFDAKRLPRGYIDASHEHNLMPNGHSLIRAAKANYINQEGDKVHTVRDHILQIDEKGNLIDVWNLGEILDPYRDSLLKALDIGAVCVNVDLESQGQTATIDKNEPYGDIPGVVSGRNWAHVNSIEYDPKDDSIILSFRHQGVAKVTRDKKVKWILAPSEGWNSELSHKLLKPVDSKGKPIKCTEKGVCEGNFDFTYTQHTAWLNDKNGRLTVLDNGDGRGYEQPALPTDKYTRYVEYKIDENKMTVEQTWEYGKERGYEWFSPITSNVEYRTDRDTMFGFGGSTSLYERGKPTIGRINEIDYQSKQVKVEIDVLSTKPNSTHYRSIIVEPNSLFGF